MSILYAILKLFVKGEPGELVRGLVRFAGITLSAALVKLVTESFIVETLTPLGLAALTAALLALERLLEAYVVRRKKAAVR